MASILNALGWRAMFWMLLALVLGLLAWAAKSLPETLPVEARQSLRPRALWQNYRRVLLRIDFVLLALIPACNFCAFFLYIASAPAFIIDLLGLSSLSFAWLFVPMIVGIMTGAWMSGRFAGRFSPLRTIRLGYALMFAGVTINLAICSLAAPWVPLNVMPIMIFTMGSSLVMPSATLILLDLFPAFRGMASSVQGFLQFTLSAAVAGTVAPFVARSLMMLAGGMAGFTLAGFALWLIYQYRARAQLKGWQP